MNLSKEECRLADEFLSQGNDDISVFKNDNEALKILSEIKEYGLIDTWIETSESSIPIFRLNENIDNFLKNGGLVQKYEKKEAKNNFNLNHKKKEESLLDVNLKNANRNTKWFYTKGIWSVVVVILGLLVTLFIKNR